MSPSRPLAWDPRPLVSAIVPVHNGERYLGAALESIFAQRYEPLEVIVVDDGSRDGSNDVAAQFGVRLVRQENGGVAAARNRGLAEARGDLLAFLDQDDAWPPGKLDTQVAFLAANPAVDFVLGGIAVLAEPGMASPRWAPSPGRALMLGALVARRDAFYRVGEFDPTLRMASDIDWFARAQETGVLSAFIDDVMLHYRLHEGNASHDMRTARGERIRLLKEAIARKRRAREHHGS